MDPYRSRLPVSSGMRPSGIRPPGTLAGLRKSYSSESVGPKAYNGPSRGQLPPLSATGRTSIYQNRNSNASSAAKPNFGALASARKSKGVGLFGMTPQNKGRPSFNPGTAQSAGRRSSIAASRHILETRPLSERSYHVQCFEKLFAVSLIFLVSIHLTNSLLSSCPRMVFVIRCHRNSSNLHQPAKCAKYLR